MATRAKFICVSKTYSHQNAEDGLAAFTVKLTGVNKCVGPQPDEEDEDSVFGKFTPHAEVEMTIYGPAADLFVPGHKVYADFHEAV